MDNIELATLVTSDSTVLEPVQPPPLISQNTTKRAPPKPKAKPATSQKILKPGPDGHSQKDSGDLKRDNSYSLRGTVELLLLLGLNSAYLWEKTMFSIRKGVSDLMNSEATKLYCNLKLVCNAIGTGVAQTLEVGESTLDMINELPRSYEEILGFAGPILEAYSKYRYSVDAVKMLHDLVKSDLNTKKIINISDDEESPENNDTDEDVFNMFSIGFGSKKTKSNPLISQVVSIRNDEVLRKCVTPGEKGKYMIKLEITACDDLKGVTQDRHWTRVWKKAVFLVNDENDTSYRTLSDIWTNQAKRILQIKDVKKMEYDEEEKPRKRAKFSR